MTSASTSLNTTALPHPRGGGPLYNEVLVSGSVNPWGVQIVRTANSVGGTTDGAVASKENRPASAGRQGRPAEAGRPRRRLLGL